MPDSHDEVQPPSSGRPLEIVFDELERNTVEVLSYQTKVMSPSTYADPTGAECIRRQLELLEEVSVVLDGGASHET